MIGKYVTTFVYYYTLVCFSHTSVEVSFLFSINRTVFMLFIGLRIISKKRLSAGLRGGSEVSMEPPFLPDYIYIIIILYYPLPSRKP